MKPACSSSEQFEIHFLSKPLTKRIFYDPSRTYTQIRNPTNAINLPRVVFLIYLLHHVRLCCCVVLLFTYIPAPIDLLHCYPQFLLIGLPLAHVCELPFEWRCRSPPKLSLAILVLPNVNPPFKYIYPENASQRIRCSPHSCEHSGNISFFR